MLIGRIRQICCLKKSSDSEMGRECASQGWGPGVPAPSPRLRDPPAALSACREVAAQGLEALPSAPMTMGWRRPCQGALRVHSERPGPACGQTGPEPSSPLLRTDCPWGLPSPHPPPQAPSDFLSSAPDLLEDARTPSCLPPGQGCPRMGGGGVGPVSHRRLPAPPSSLQPIVPGGAEARTWGSRGSSCPGKAQGPWTDLFARPLPRSARPCSPTPRPGCPPPDHAKG